MRILLLLLLTLTQLESGEPAAIREVAESQTMFPPSMKIEDVKTVFGAKGDGVTDDTAALQAAINRPKAFVYLPNGTYLVRDRLIYDHGPSIGPTIIGESRDGVILQLAPDVRGFDDPANPRAVLRTVPDRKVSADFFKIRVRNLTINCGDHKGAIGLQFYANHTGQCRNVRVVGNGVAGLDLSHDLNGPLYVSHLVVEGFESGVLAGSGPYNSQTLEHLYLTGQSKYAIQNEGECLSIRKLVSDNTCTALLAGGNTILIDSELRGGSGSQPAIISGGSLFVRNTEISSSYEIGIQGHEYHWKNGLGAKTEETHPAGKIEEWVHGNRVSQWRTQERIESLNLPVEDPPHSTASSNFEKWVCIDDFGADGTDKQDDSAALAEALTFAKNNGKEVVAFSAGGTYRLNGEFEIGGSIRRLQGAGSFLLHGKEEGILFKVIDGDTEVVNFDLFCKSLSPNYRIKIENASSRTLVLDCVRGELIASGPGRTFLTDSCHEVDITNPDAQVWARQLNSESKEAIANYNQGGTLWVLGMKSEKTPTLIATSGGGRTEVLGTWAYVISKTPPENPLWIIEESEASFAGIVQWHHQRKFYDTLVRETQGDDLREFTRSKNDGKAALPLYRSK
ncbi:MAG: glycosyl hydrolase family 28-related protein [Verrucomicrobiota bacterium]